MWYCRVYDFKKQKNTVCIPNARDIKKKKIQREATGATDSIYIVYKTDEKTDLLVLKITANEADSDQIS